MVTVLLSQEKVPASFAPSSRIGQTEQVLRASIASLLLLLFIDLSLQLHALGSLSLIGFIVIPALLATERQAVIRIRQQLHTRGCGIDRAFLYLCDPAENAEIDPAGLRAAGLEIVATSGYQDALLANPTTIDTINSSSLRALRCDIVLIAGTGEFPKAVRAVTAISEEAGIPAAIIEVGTFTLRSTPTKRIQPPQLIDVFRPQTGRLSSLQRILDVAIAAPLLLLLAPAFFLIAIMVRVDSSGPSIFTQERVGKDGRHFRILKFRTMFVTASQYAASPIDSSDPRITRTGRILRRLSLDELPQLVNVLIGNMALVGPRPEMPFLVERHPTLHRQRLKAKPGITGLWQLSGDRPRPIHENVHHDLYYIQNSSFFLDLAILVHTLFRATLGGI